MPTTPRALVGRFAAVMAAVPHPPIDAASQHGVFTAGQAREAGISGKVQRRVLRDGHWTVVLGSVYAERGHQLTPASLAHAAALAVGVEAVVSHATSARLWTLLVPPDPEVHVIVGRNRRLAIPGVRAHRIEVDDAELVRRGGVVMTTLLRTVVDCLLWLPAEAGRALMVDALRRDVVRYDDVHAALATVGQRHGLTRAWSVLRDVRAGAHSEGEVRLHRLLAAAGLTGWVANAEIHDDAGLVGIADVLFRAARLVIEVDGRAFHVDEHSFQNDRTRQNRLVAAGWTVLRFTWHDLTQRPDSVVAVVRRELGRAGLAA